jgi:predicted DNA-binding transcriptional regulator YafY
MSTRLERIIYIDQQIRARRYPSAATLAGHFEVSKRTIYEDRAFMVDRFRAPIIYDAEHGGWAYTDDMWVLPAMMVSEGELLAFFLSQVIAQHYLGTPFEAPLRSALRHLMQYLPDHVQVNVQEIAQHYTFRAGATVAVNAQLMLDLERAIREHRQVRITYYVASRGERTERVVDPYHFYNVRGDWYLIAYDHLRGEMRNFHLGRIEQWEILSSTFEPDATFCIQEYLAEGFLTSMGAVYDIVIRFDAYQARWIRERQWHPTQQIEELPDGGLILRLRCGGLDEVRRWVMSYGSHAEVLTPPELRRVVAEEAVKMVQRYAE